MPNVAARMARAALTTTSATLYTVPAGTTALVTEIIINNTALVEITPTVNLAGVSFISASPIPAGGMLVVGMKQVLSAAETITGLASAAGCNIFISGVHVT